MRLGSGKIDGFLFTGLFNAVSAVVLITAYFVSTKMGWVLPVNPSNYSLGLVGIIIALGFCVALFDLFVFNMLTRGGSITLGFPLIYICIFSATAIIGVLFFKDSISWQQIAGLILGLIAIYLITRPISS